MGRKWSSPCRRDGEVENSALRAVTSPLPEEEGLEEKVELSLQERRRGRKFSTGGRFSSSSLRFLSPANGGTEGGVKTIEGRFSKKTSFMGKSDANECNESCFQIAECSSLYQKRRTG